MKVLSTLYEHPKICDSRKRRCFARTPTTDRPLQAILARGKVRPFIAVLAADLRSQASPPWSLEPHGPTYAYNSSTNVARLASSG